MLHPVFAYRNFDFGLARSRLQSQAYLSSAVGPQHIPALRFAARLADSGRALIVRVNLHGQLFFREQKFDQKREASGISGGIAKELSAEFLRQIGQSPAGKWAVANGAIVAREPCLANRITRNFTGIKRR